MSKTSWKSIQQQLKKLQFEPGPIDGVQGSKTINAIKAFQKAHGLTADGVVGPKTRSALFGSSEAVDHSVMTCARLAQISYTLRPKKLTSGDRTLEKDFKLSVTKSCPHANVEAYMLSNGCLLIPGSNSFADYLSHNLRLKRVGSKKLKLSYLHARNDVFSSGTKRGVSRTIWHQGFLAHANIIYNWIGKDPSKWPKFIIGHSLGAASAQILSKTFLTPAIGFAAPRLRKTSGAVKYDNLSLSICRDDDIVCNLPPGFHHTGQTSILYHKNRKRGLNHKMESYIDALKNQPPGLHVPTVWDP
jgi:hypothetical protein